MLVPLLFCVKVSDHKDWLWSGIFAPLWILDTIVVLMICIYPLMPTNMARGDPLSTFKFDLLAQALCVVVFQVFISFKLDGGEWSWMAVFCPWFVFQTIRTALAIYSITPSQYAAIAKTKQAGST